MENLLSFFEDAPEAFWVIDENYRLIYANKSFYVSIENTYKRNISKGDVLLNLLSPGSEDYLFWKNSYDKAFQFKQYCTELHRKGSLPRIRKKFDFRLIESLAKFLCIRAVTVDEVTGDFKLSSLSNDNSEFTLSIDEHGNILRISPDVKNILGYFTEWMENKSVIDFLHPEERDLLRNFFKDNESMERTWCRIRDVNGKYFWCNIQMAAFGKMQVNRKFVITINEIRLQKTPANLFVPDTDILQVISEAQSIYIGTVNAKKACDTCLLYFQNEGISPFSFVAKLNWLGTQPILKIVSTYGTWVHAGENSVRNLLSTLSVKCYELQQAINNNVSKEINSGFIIAFEGTYFMMYLLIYETEIVGVLVTSDLSLEGEIPKVNPLITYFKPLFVSVLQSSRFLKNANIALHKLAVSRDELQSLVTSLDDIILEVNTNYELVNIWCNDEAILSLPRDLMKGKKIREVKGEVLGPLFEEAIEKVIRTESSYSIEYLDPPDSKVEWFAAKMNLVRMFNGEKRVSILIQDISQRKKAEAIITDTLKKEKELNEMKSKMITSISHEFRTPLSTIVSSTELLEMYIKKDYATISNSTSELFGNIYEEVDRLSDMLRNFLVMGRFEENQTPFRPKDTDVKALVYRIIRTRFYAKYGEAKVKIIVKNEPRNAYLDPSLFWHILSNLVSNAIKYSPEDQKVILKLEFLDNEFLLSVSDKGIGVPEEDLPNIFQSFYRATNSEEHSGYGLGLSIVERFIKMHHAGIEVKSKLGEGSTFIIHFKYLIYEKNQTVIN
jgi:PAS domain S-box-containing protein